jgi:hypothetical protein
MSIPPICLLGLRTGSSLATRALALLGLDPGEEAHLMEGKADDNPKGFWEQQPLVDLNDDLLAELGGPWWDTPALAPGWHEDPALAPFRERARALVKELFPDDRQWVWKDPRSSVTLPFWQDVIGPMRYVVCVRAPAEVAASLNARDPVAHPWVESTRLYFRLLCAGLEHTAGEDRIVLFYEDWFTEFDAQLDRLARFALGSRPTDETRASVGEFFETNLRHHQAAGDDDLDPELRDAWRILREGTDADGRLDPGDERKVQALWSALDERVDDHGSDLRRRARAMWLLAHRRHAHIGDAVRAFESERAALTELERRHAQTLERMSELERRASEAEERTRELERQAADQEAELGQTRDWLAGMNRSTSWRLTAPLRAVKRLLRRS